MNVLVTKNSLIVLLVLSLATSAWAQPANDDCTDARVLTDVMDWCSANEEFNNIGAVPSGFGPPSCFAASENDVWFAFTAVATDVVIVVKGNTTVAPGGSLVNPQVALYFGDCQGTINQVGCETPNVGLNIAELYEGGMVVGQTYYIRVQGGSGATGTFQLCVDNFNPPVQPGSDCVTASILCDKTPFVVQQVIGAGNEPNEASNSSCLGGFGSSSESNSTWFTWIAANDGLLTFTLSPLNISDDLDFVLYELPGGPLDCNNKVELRCMASGDFPANFPSPCLGPTGLAMGETDLSEPAGCGDPTQNSFLAPLEMEAGKAYTLMVNNFSGTGNGFSMEFGGDGDIAGPEASIQTDPETVCSGQQLLVSQTSSFALGTVNSWQWSFGIGATPSTATGQGPHAVSWDRPGLKSIVLTVGSDLGCQVTTIRPLTIDPCCDSFNEINLDAQITDLLCSTIFDGAIDLTPTSNAPGYIYEWSTGAISEDLMDLPSGMYDVTVTNAATCEVEGTFTVGGPEAIIIGSEITMPQCMGGMDGAIVLEVSGGFPPYQYDWGSGLTNDNTLTNIGVGIYEVTVQDATDCQQSISLDVRELELVLDAATPTVTLPSCFDTNDGRIVLSVANGTPPYLFDFNDGNGFVSNNTLTGLNNGTFNIAFQDASGCVGDTMILLTPPDPVTVIANVVNVSCFGEGDGIAQVTPLGGVGNYTFQWDDPQAQTDSVAVGLGPGLYQVTIADGNGCSTTATMTVSEPAELSVEVVNLENVLCFGDTTGSISVLGAGGNPDYSYSVDGVNFQTDTLFQDLLAGTYEIFVLDQLGCMASVEGTIDEPAELVVDVGRDTTVDLGFPVRLSAISFPLFRPVTYAWSPEQDFNCIDCARVEVIAPNTTIYEVVVTDETGCTAVDSVQISVVKNRPIYIPNAFSPNNDGVNDYFTVFGNPGALSIHE
ncbi:MAG: hypothetical protein AAGD05_07955, partial [Bacteroidota bacterium]